jgi:hypothetical protein
MFPLWCFLACWVVGDIKNWYQRRMFTHMFPLVVVGDVTKWYQSQGFNTEPGWAMLVVNEKKISE